MRAVEHLVELGLHSFFLYYGKALHVCLHAPVRIRVNVPVITGGKAHGTEYAHRVVVESRVGIIGRADYVMLYVVDATAQYVEHTLLGDIVVKGIDCEVAAATIRLYAAKHDRRVAARRVGIFFGACLHDFNLVVGKFGKAQHRRAESRKTDRFFHGKTALVEPVGKGNAPVGQRHCQVNVLDFAAYYLVAAAAPHGIEVALPRRTVNQTVQV